VAVSIVGLSLRLVNVVNHSNDKSAATLTIYPRKDDNSHKQTVRAPL